MLPFLHIGPYAQPTYGLMLCLAIMTAVFVVDRAFKRAHLTADAVGMVAVAAVSGIVGSKIWYLVLDSPGDFRAMGWDALWRTDGFSWFGALVCGILALVVQGWRAKIGGLRTLDLAAPAAAIGQGLGRIGCFLSGDGCYGIAIQPVHLFGFTFKAWGMAFPHGIVPVFVPVYPTPLYEAAIGLAIGGWLWWRLGKPHATGAIMGQYLIFAGTARFLVEFIRRNPKILWGLSNEQLTSAGAVVVGVALMWWAARRPALRSRKASAPVVKPA
ncbi:MAG: prolipoprotein diacylglyceryl transferase [Terracidiphilus sp.]